MTEKHVTKENTNNGDKCEEVEIEMDEEVYLKLSMQAKKEGLSVGEYAAKVITACFELRSMRAGSKKKPF